MTYLGQEKPSLEVLTHHGVKGMEWGVVRQDVSVGGGSVAAKPTRAEKKVAKADGKFEKEIGNANKGKPTLAFHNAMVSRINNNIDSLNSSDKYRNIDTVSLQGKQRDEYDNDAKDVINRAFEDATRAHFGYNPSGTKRAVYNRDKDQIDIVSVSKVQHADARTETAPDVTVKLKRNAKGFIVSTEVGELDLQHGLVVEDSFPADYLEHHGIKGMQWGVRRGSLQSRVKGAVDDSLQRRITTAKAISTGNAKGRDRIRSTFFTFAGWTQSKKLASRRVNVLEKRKERIDAGEAKVSDVLSQVGHVPLRDLVVSRRDKRGDAPNSIGA